MFTGIVEAMGRLAGRKEAARIFSLTIESSLLAPELRAGASVAVSGVCLTVTACQGECFTVDVSNETARRTTLTRLREGSRVNLERPLPADGRLGGHFVQGHIDATGEVVRLEKRGGDRVLRVGHPPGSDLYVVEKGSIAVDGVSLTVTRCGPGWFEVMLIPYTLQNTTLGGLDSRDEVNLEYDILAKYVARLVGPEKIEGRGHG